MAKTYPTTALPPSKVRSGPKPKPPILAINDLLAEVQVASTGCWEWPGSRDKDGYGYRSQGRRSGETRTHRIAWTVKNGPIPAGYLICHKCDNPPCCNPDHLFLGTMSDNIKDAVNKGRVRPPYTYRATVGGVPQCINGHAMTVDNTRVVVRKGVSSTECRTCRRAHWARYSKKAAAARWGKKK